MSYRNIISKLHGYSFTFEDQGQSIRAWFSNWTGLEKVYVNDDLVLSRRTLSFSPKPNVFEVGGSEYSIALQMLADPMQATLLKDGRKISKKAPNRL